MGAEQEEGEAVSEAVEEDLLPEGVPMVKVRRSRRRIIFWI